MQRVLSTCLSRCVCVTVAGAALWASFVNDAVAQGAADSDRAVLEAFYEATGGPRWKVGTNWITEAPLGEWHGVESDADGRVVGLRLSANQLTGPLPRELGNLVSLRVLDLDRNELTGLLPRELEGLVNLERLFIWRNQLTGTLPAWLGNMTSLRSLALGWNEFTGPVPHELGRLVNLTHLHLDENQLTGSLPRELGNLVSLQHLEFTWNQLTGPIPASLGNLTELRNLELGSNDLTGPVPAELKNLTKLTRLDLSKNWGLTGPLPAGLEDSDLEELNAFVTQTCAPAAWQEWLTTIESYVPPCEAQTDRATIDVAIVYTPAAREEAGDTSTIEAEIDLMLAETNAAYAASGVHQRLVLVGRGEVPYTEASGGVDLDRLVDPEDGHMDEAHELREQTGADLVHLIVADSNVCGIAYLPGAFALTVLDCGGLVLAHEIGHNMGLHHDRFQDLIRGGSVDPHPAYGYVNQQIFEGDAPPSSRWVTIMSYIDQCNLISARCSRLPRFSNPRQRHDGDPLGIAHGEGSGLTGPADAVAVLNATGPAVATWRERPDDATNRPPTLVGTLPNQRLESVGRTLEVDVSRAFVDPDDDPLAYSVSSSAPRVVTATSVGARVALAAKSTGSATISVTAQDPGGLSVTGTFMVTVEDTEGADPETGTDSDRAVLAAFYEATGGPRWKVNTNWMTEAPLGEWHGVETNDAGQVKSLELSNNNLTGPIPVELGNLATLKELNLGHNALSGEIPVELGGLTQLNSLFLQWNNLTGPIPVALGNLATLAWLNLAYNVLLGEIPAELGSLTQLRYLRLQSNDLTGPIPAELGNLVKLTDLYLGDNELTGTIPTELSKLTMLRLLNLEGNDLMGPIPPELGSLAHLGSLFLHDNWGLTGPLPAGLENSDLEELNAFVTQTCAPAAWQEWLTTIESHVPPCETRTDLTTIDVAVVYTPAAREEAGDTSAIEAEIDLMLAETNAAYAASGVHQRLVLVGRGEVPYTEASGGVDLDRLVDPEDGHMDEAHELREQTGADLVHLIVADSNVCGIAYLPGAFALTVLDCGGLVLAHEIGHNMGLHHDRFQDLIRGGSVDPHPAYGYVNQQIFEGDAPPSSRWVTIMSYIDQCNLISARCSRLPRFSNPRQRHDGDPLGIAHGEGSGLTGPADAVAVLNVTGPAVAAWRERPDDATNRPPTLVGTLPNQHLESVGSTLDVDVSRAFVDPDDDPLAYSVSSSAPRVVTATSVGARVTLTAIGNGTATIRVTATDPGGMNADGTFTVTVATQSPVLQQFTDDPIQPGVTPVKAIHFMELRARINALRDAAALPQFRWTDPDLRAGVTPVRLVHLIELRDALSAAYVAAGQPAPQWTDAAPLAGSTPIRAVHVTELRAMVVALE